MGDSMFDPDLHFVRTKAGKYLCMRFGDGWMFLSPDMTRKFFPSIPTIHEIHAMVGNFTLEEFSDES
jgi:hypothetical protein